MSRNHYKDDANCELLQRLPQLNTRLHCSRPSMSRAYTNQREAITVAVGESGAFCYRGKLLHAQYLWKYYCYWSNIDECTLHQLAFGASARLSLTEEVRWLIAAGVSCDCKSIFHPSWNFSSFWEILIHLDHIRVRFKITKYFCKSCVSSARPCLLHNRHICSRSWESHLSNEWGKLKHCCNNVRMLMLIRSATSAITAVVYLCFLDSVRLLGAKLMFSSRYISFLSRSLFTIRPISERYDGRIITVY